MVRSPSFPLLKLLLAFLLFAGQCVYAAHEVDMLGGQHDHGSECIVCSLEQNTESTVTLLRGALPLLVEPSKPLYWRGDKLASTSFSEPIRGPPFP